MATFGIDVSHYQTLNVRDVSKQGFEFFAAKCTEGASYADPGYSTFLSEAKAAGALFIAYHFLRSDSSADAQAANLERHIIDKSIPVMLDCEVSGSSRPDLGTCRAFRDACAKRGIRVTLLYYPHFWWASTGTPDLHGWNLWQAIYPNSRHEFAAAEYQVDGANSGSGWVVQGGVTPVIWQYASTGRLGSYNGNVDVDAYRGTRADLAATHLFKDFGHQVAPAPKPPHVTPAPAPAPKPQSNIGQARHDLELAAAYAKKRKWVLRLARIQKALHLLPKN